jgi:adenylosuccinate lyase
MENLDKKTYSSPFSERYASQEMSYLFSPYFKILTFRKLWISLAKAQKTAGLPISSTQIRQMEAALEEIDFSLAEKYEKKFRHDVMAHIHAFGDVCPEAKPIIHLGATSCYATDNADLIQLKAALEILIQKLLHIIERLAIFADTYASTPTLSYTHYQPAQPTTFGKRACLWIQDFLLDAIEWSRLLENLPFLGAKGATGTQGSFLALFEGDSAKVDKLESLIAKDFGFKKILPISGQTYTRKLDLNILNALASFCASAHKMATDIRLLSHDGELVESLDKNQVGSSAMPYKKNPIYSERICGISRFVISLSQNATYTTATQWLERSLDDSSNRRLSIPESFLGVDAVLNLLSHLIDHLVPMPMVASEHIEKELPFLVMENILMEAVKRGGNRQELHEKLRHFSEKKSIDFLIREIEKDSTFYLKEKDIKLLLKISSLIGRAPEQVHLFLTQEVNPYLKSHKKSNIVIPKIQF